MKNAADNAWIALNADTAEVLGALSPEQVEQYKEEAGITEDCHEGRNSGIVAGDEYGFEGSNIYCIEDVDPGTVSNDDTAVSKITDEQIEALRREAGLAGDEGAVELCRRALSGDVSARSECAGMIEDAAASAI